jgi:hypothetical protein
MASMIQICYSALRFNIQLKSRFKAIIMRLTCNERPTLWELFNNVVVRKLKVNKK